MNDLYILCAIAVVVIIIVIFQTTNDWQNFMNGYWESTDAFNRRADIYKASALIKDDQIYLLLDSGDDIILNTFTKWRLTPCVSNVVSDVLKYDVEFEDDVAPLDKNMQLRYKPESGLIGFYSDDVLMLELVRDNMASLCTV